MKMYNEYLIWLKRTHGISPESLYMGVNVMRELIQMRNENLSPRWKKSLYPLTWEEYKEVYGNGLIQHRIDKHTMI